MTDPRKVHAANSSVAPQRPTIGARGWLAFQRLLPRRRISAWTWRIARCRTRWFKNLLIRGFARLYTIDWSEAQTQNPRAFVSFNAFFTRALRDGARPLPADATALVSPCDGRAVHAQAVDGDTLLQAKGIPYTLAALLGDAVDATPYSGGLALTVYLAPRDYHRVHMPLAGTLAATRYIPGDRFSVNATTTQHLPGLFTRNERLVCHFETAIGPVAVVLVGALNVGSIETVWAGEYQGATVQHRVFPASALRVHLERGTELGRFNMGSTVILLLPPDRVHFAADLLPGRVLRMGEAIAEPRSSA